MTQKLSELAALTSGYPDFKTRFEAFCVHTKNKLDNNEFFPGIDFSWNESADKAVMRVFDQDFIIRFHLLILDSQPKAVLAIYLPKANHEDEMVWHTFFDRLGNVQTSPSVSGYSESMDKSEITGVVLSEALKKYFSIQNERFNPPGPSIQNL